MLGPVNMMLAAFVICAIALIPTIALPYKQIGSLVHGDEQLAHADK